MYQLKTEQFIKTDLTTAWEFFSNPKNLALITPDTLGFKIKNEVADKMYEGIMISYTVKPLLGIPLNWVTEITKIKEKEYFIDEQRKGPYKIWHHEHHFKEVNGGVQMSDVLSYEIPYGSLGKLMKSFIKKKIEEIFAFREKKVDELFNSTK